MLVLATAIIYGYSRSEQNEPGASNAKQAYLNDPKGNTAVINNPEKAPGSKPGILLILTADKSKPGWSSSFLQNFIYGNANKTGC